MFLSLTPFLSLSVYRALTSAEIKEIGSSKSSVYWSGIVAGAATSLQQMGFPRAWVCRALRICHLNRVQASRWILSHQNQLREHDELAKLRETASCLSWTGFSRTACMKSLQRHHGDFRDAVTELLQTIHFGVSGPDSSGSLDGNAITVMTSFDEEDPGDESAGHTITNSAMHCLDEGGVSSNPAYRILDSCSDSMSTTLGGVPATKLPQRHLLVSRTFSDVSNPELLDEIIKLQQQLRVVHSRRAVLALIKQKRGICSNQLAVLFRHQQS